MNDYDRLKKMLENSKEDSPVSCGMFREFLNNHFNSLKKDVILNRKLLWIILGAIIVTGIASLFRG